MSPLSVSETVAFLHLSGAEPTAADMRLLLRIDTAYRTIMATPRKQPLQEAKMDDVEGVKALFGSMKRTTKKDG
jgi:hypothetical protein